MKTLYIDYTSGSNYFLVGKGGNIKVKYSKTGQWYESIKGTSALEIREVADCRYVVSVGGTSIDLDLCDLANLRLALNEIAKRHPNTFTKYKRAVL